MTEHLKAEYAIIGAGIAGISAAEAIREIDPDGSILLLNGENVPPYCRPLIVEVLRDERTFDSIRLRDPDWYVRNRITLISDNPVSKIDTTGKTLELKSGQKVEFGKALIATGSVPSNPPIKGLDRVPYSTLYRESDISGLKALCKPGATALLVGIGLIGLQATASLKESGVHVIACELMPKVLPLVLDIKAARYAQSALEKHGVDVRVGTGVREFILSDGAEHPYAALTDKGGEIGFDFLVMATGMRPDLSLLDGTNIELDRGIIVSDSMETSAKDIYAAGDVTVYNNWIEGRPEIHAHWVNAYHQGRIAGINMAGGTTEPYEPVYLNSLNVFGLPIITIGASRLDDTDNLQVFEEESPSRPFYKRFIFDDGRLIAVTFVNNVEGAGVYQYLIRNRIEIGDNAESLFRQGIEGMEFLYAQHEAEVSGDVDWPESMSRIKWFKKDQSHTRWGKKEDAKK